MQLPQSVHLVDLDGDGALDLLVGSDSVADLVEVRRGNGDGTFGPGRDVWVHWNQTTAVGDLDRDGRPDVVAAGDHAVHVLKNVCRPR